MGPGDYRALLFMRNSAHEVIVLNPKKFNIPTIGYWQ